MDYPVGAMERAMKIHEVILRALSGQLTWLQAGRSPEAGSRQLGDDWTTRWSIVHPGSNVRLSSRADRNVGQVMIGEVANARIGAVEDAAPELDVVLDQPLAQVEDVHFTLSGARIGI